MNDSVLPIIVASLLQLFSLGSPKWQNGNIRVMLTTAFGVVTSVSIQYLIRSHGPTGTAGLH